MVLTGGHRAHGSQALDLVRLADGRHLTLESPWVETRCTHGTGCTFSSAIAAGLALGSPPEAAIQSAKHYLSRALLSAAPMGKGHGPVDHLWALSSALVDPHE